LEIQRKCYENGGREYQQAYLDSLKKTNFFKWKARKSYVELTEHELKQLWDSQNGKCALTGRLLDDDAELDHIVPRTRGGGNNYENMRWLCAEANQAKRNLLDSEFLILCHEIIAWAGQDQ
jgi:5-methylcytosine-specific restriction endonuclease McrA